MRLLRAARSNRKVILLQAALASWQQFTLRILGDAHGTRCEIPYIIYHNYNHISYIYIYSYILVMNTYISYNYIIMINNGYEIDAEINADPLLYNIYQEIYSQNFGDVFSVF